MTVTPTTIPDVIILEPEVYGDSRGFFFEIFNHIKIPWRISLGHIPVLRTQHRGILVRASQVNTNGLHPGRNRLPPRHIELSQLSNGVRIR